MKGDRTSGAGEEKEKVKMVMKGDRTSGAGEEKEKVMMVTKGDRTSGAGEEKEKVMKGDRTSGAGEEKVRRSAAAPAELTSLYAIGALTKIAIFGGGCYLGFLSYVAVTYTHSWVEKLRLLPLFIFSVTVPLMGAVMLRK